MNYGSAGGLHDNATYLTLKMDIVLRQRLAGLRRTDSED